MYGHTFKGTSHAIIVNIDSQLIKQQTLT